MNEAVKMAPFFKFYGGKFRDSPRNYPAPKHQTVVEPFCGSAGYSVRNYKRDVVLADKDPVICGIWDYLIKASPDEIMALPDVANGQRVDSLDIPVAAQGLIGFWLNAGVDRPCKVPGSWMRSGVAPGTFWGGGSQVSYRKAGGSHTALASPQRAVRVSARSGYGDLVH